jgi:alkylation response protein AidB-like acyl-CoA dehydrogenase
MDLNLSAEQRMLRDSARGFLVREWSLERTRAMENDPAGYDAELWRRIAGMGWCGLAKDFLDLAIVLEETGRALLPSPLVASSLVAASLLGALGRSAEVGALASGERLGVLALVEPGWRDETGEIALAARAEGAKIAVSGTKLFVPFAPAADWLLVAARLDGAPIVLAIERGMPGLEFERLRTLDGGHGYEVRLDGVRVDRRSCLGPGGVERALGSALDRAGIAALAEMTGAAERVLEMTVEYAKTRVQFGRPIGAFQAVAHRCADMRADLDALRVLVWQAAWRLSVGGHAELEVGAARAFGVEALRRIAVHAHQVHGAIGFSTECDLQLFTRRMKAAELTWGSATFHRERVARAMGL